MTIQEFLTFSIAKLAKAGITTARLDCLVLLEDATGKDRSYLLAHPEHILQGRTLQRLRGGVLRRMEHVPLAYIREKSEFYGREFIVNKHVLVPRPETETMIELLKELMSEEQRNSSKELEFADIGTGSGCIAITAKLEIPQAKLYASDISEHCLKIARNNAKYLDADVTFYQGNLLEPIIAHCSQLTALLCNLPYVPSDYPINKAATHEPKPAIFGGNDGLHLYRNLFAQIGHLHQKPTYVLTESLPFQHNALESIAKNANYKLLNSYDLIQVFMTARHTA